MRGACCARSQRLRPGAGLTGMSRPVTRLTLCRWRCGGAGRDAADAVPPQRQADRGGDQQAAEAREPRGEVLLLVRDGDRAGQVGQRALELVGVLRLVEAGLGISIEPLSSVRGANMNIKIIELKNLPQKVSMILFWLREREEELSRFIRMF